jgi:uncharacterized short protein YbdD (DUF466 family)
MYRAAGKIAKLVTRLFQRVREWCGDTAYEKYCSAAKRKKMTSLVTREQFYVEQLQRRYSRPSRCC